MTVWIAGKVNSQDGQCWEFQGVFDSEEKAVASCRDASYFVGPAQMNKSLPDDVVVWPGSYYPLAAEAQ